MRVRTFIAPTLSQAKEKVRAALGDDAVVLSTSSTPGGGVEIKAAIDRVKTAAEPAGVDKAGLDAELERRIAMQVLSHLRQDNSPKDDVKSRFAEQLRLLVIQHGGGDDLADAIIKGASKTEALNPEAALKSGFELAFEFAPLPVVPSRPIILVGPTGAGKTSTAARLAARVIAAGSAPKIFGADVTRAGAIDQIRTYADALETPFWTVETPNDLVRTLRIADGDGPVIIDAPGINPFDRQEVQDLEALIAAGSAEPVLVLPASGDRGEYEDLVRLFRTLGARRIIITKIDSSRRVGAALAAAHAGRLALAHFGVSPFIADGLRSANAGVIADRLLEDRSAVPQPSVATA